MGPPYTGLFFFFLFLVCWNPTLVSCTLQPNFFFMHLIPFLHNPHPPKTKKNTFFLFCWKNKKKKHSFLSHIHFFKDIWSWRWRGGKQTKKQKNIYFFISFVLFFLKRVALINLVSHLWTLYQISTAHSCPSLYSYYFLSDPKYSALGLSPRTFLVIQTPPSTQPNFFNPFLPNRRN